jgi:HK97 family phage portal protein
MISTHPALDLLDDMNGYLTRYFTFLRLQSNMELYGNEYWFIDFNGNTPVGIYPLNPRSVTPNLDQFEYVASYTYVLNSEKIIIPRKNIIHFRNYSPTSDVIGMSTITQAKHAVETDEYARNFNKAFFENNAQPAGTLNTTQSLTEDQIKSIKKQWDEEFKGAKKSHKMAVLHSGATFNKVDVTHEDMEFIEQRRFSRDEILSIFRVPKTILGILEDTNFASAKTANYVFALRTIAPKVKMILDTLNTFFLPLFGQKNLIFDSRNLIPEDRAELISYYTAGINGGWVTQNEERRKEGLSEVENGNALFLPFNLSQVGQVTKSVQVSSPIQKIAMELAEVVLKSIEEPKKEEIKMYVRLEKIGKAKNERQILRAEKWELKLKNIINDFFKGQRERALEGVKRDLSKKSYKSSKHNVLDYDREIKATIDLFTPIMTELIKSEGQAAYDYLDMSEDFDVEEPSIIKFINKSIKKLSGEITETTISEIGLIISRGVDSGLSFDEIASEVSNYTGFSESRSLNIARTEVTRAQVETELQVWEDLGVVKAMQWYTAEDERVCELCSPMHGKEISIGDEFLTLEEMEKVGVSNYNGAISGPPLHPSCRCTLIPLVEKSKGLKPKEKTSGQLLSDYLSLKNG